MYGHRGARAELPENTMLAFERALEVGADALEMDVHMTRDGVVVVIHDKDGRRVANDAACVRDSAWSTVRRWRTGNAFVDAQGERPFAGDARFSVPAFEEVLEAFPGVLLNVDLKQVEPDMVPAFVRLVRGARAEDRVRIASFSTRNLARARHLGYAGETGLGGAEVLRLWATPLAALRRMPLDGTAAQVPLRQGPVDLTTPSFLAKCRALGVRVDYWTVDDPAVARDLFARGADGFITDDPRALAAAFPA